MKVAEADGGSYWSYDTTTITAGDQRFLSGGQRDLENCPCISVPGLRCLGGIRASSGSTETASLMTDNDLVTQGGLVSFTIGKSHDLFTWDRELY